MRQRFLIISLIIVGLAATAAAADVSGKWSGQVPARGEAAAATFVFKVEGDKLTGTMTSPQGEAALQEGKVAGDKISFSMTGGNAKILFTGTVAGDEIKMTRTREGGEGREFTLKRAK
ncbi:MAG: hypothetical protein ACRD8O_06535 [Bryobacteraceae bacterium]